MLLRKKENQKRAKNVRQKMKEKWKMENESKAEGEIKLKKQTATHRELLKLNIKCQRQAKAEAKARTKAQKSCHMQRSSAKMAATCLTSCKRAKGIREAAKEGEESSVCVEVFGKNEVDASATPRHATPSHSVPKTIAPANEIKQEHCILPSRDH